jgi:hypothetical protein
VTGASLLTGMPVYHGIGAGELTAAEEATFEKWHRRTEKSLTGSKVKVFTGTAWITWRQMILRDVILNELTDTLLHHKTTQQVIDMEPFKRKKFVTGDILLCAFLEAKLFERAQTKISSCPTAFHKWQKLEETYAKQSVAAQNGLTEQWNGVKQTASQSVEQYIEKLDFMAMEMAAAGIPPSGQAKLYTLLAGLARGWDTEVKILKRTHASYEEACEILLEAGIEKATSQAEEKEHAYAAGPYRGGGEYPKGGYRGGRAQRPMTCLVCGVSGHGSWTCPTGLRLNRDKYGAAILRCYNCLTEGHGAGDCKDEKRVFGSFKPGDVARGRQAKPSQGGQGTQGPSDTVP